MKRLSKLMLLSNLLCTLFYATSYPYIYAETVKAVPHLYISIEQIMMCLGTIIICKLWNTHSDKLFRYYKMILLAEILADLVLFLDVIIRQNLSFYFLLNIGIACTITKNLSCGGVKIRAMVNPSEKEREQFDNNSNIVNAAATLVGAFVSIIAKFDFKILFILAFIGNIIDNFFYLYIYQKIKENN